MVPKVAVRIYAGDSAAGGITRAQDNERISCVMPDIDRFACMTYDDLKKIYAVMQSCRDWGPVKQETVDDVMWRNQDVSERIKKMGSLK